jgi:ABC-type anion transport system duplicated permease subunit
MLIADAENAAAALEATAAFSDLIEFHLVPVLDIMESVPISARVLGWIDSVG